MHIAVLRPVALAALSCLTLPLAAFGQDAPLSLKGCGKPREILGTVRSAGTIAVWIDSRGYADTSSIVVTAVDAGTAAGLRSALSRQLPTCRFRVKREEGAATWYGFDVRWKGNDLVVTRLVLLGRTSPVPVAPVTFSLPFEISEHDDMLEEAPRITRCNLPTPRNVAVRTNGGVSRTLQESDTLPESRIVSITGKQAGEESGETWIEYVVTPEGRVDLATFMLVEGDSPQYARDHAQRLAKCRFAPGRVEGIPVRVRMASQSIVIIGPTGLLEARPDPPPGPRDGPTDFPRPCGISHTCLPGQ